MRIFMYSDLHISKTSSIMPQNITGSKYSYRQQKILETGKYLVDIIDKEKPDLIINLGDTFDQHTLTSYDISIASEFFKCFRYLSIPHLVIVGNHEMVNYEFNAIDILSNIDNITVISEPTTIDLNLLSAFNPNSDVVVQSANNEIQSAKIALMPYMEYKDILSFPDGDFLFSHIDIMGMTIRGNYELPEGVSADQLQKYKLVFNGHIHKPSMKGNVVNVGSISTHSFSDDNDSVPQCYIFDTETLDLKTFRPTMWPLFRKVEITSEEDLVKHLNYMDKDYTYIMQVTCPFEIKESVKDLLSKAEFIIASRLNVKAEQNKDTSEKIDIEVQSNVDIKKSFTEFLDTVDELKYPKQLYLDILEGVK